MELPAGASAGDRVKIWLNVTTDDGELLGRIEIPVAEDKLYPIGTSMARAAKSRTFLDPNLRTRNPESAYPTAANKSVTIGGSPT